MRSGTDSVPLAKHADDPSFCDRSGAPRQLRCLREGKPWRFAYARSKRPSCRAAHIRAATQTRRPRTDNTTLTKIRAFMNGSYPGRSRCTQGDAASRSSAALLSAAPSPKEGLPARCHASRSDRRQNSHSRQPTTRSATSSSGPGIGSTPKAARPRTGLGIRPSRARIFTARISRRMASTISQVVRPSRHGASCAHRSSRPRCGSRARSAGVVLLCRPASTAFCLVSKESGSGSLSALDAVHPASVLLDCVDESLSHLQVLLIA